MKKNWEVTVGLFNNWEERAKYVTFTYRNCTRYEANDYAENDATVFPFKHSFIADIREAL